MSKVRVTPILAGHPLRKVVALVISDPRVHGEDQHACFVETALGDVTAMDDPKVPILRRWAVACRAGATRMSVSVEAALAVYENDPVIRAGGVRYIERALQYSDGFVTHFLTWREEP